MRAAHNCTLASDARKEYSSLCRCPFRHRREIPLASRVSRGHVTFFLIECKVRRLKALSLYVKSFFTPSPTPPPAPSSPESLICVPAVEQRCSLLPAFRGPSGLQGSRNPSRYSTSYSTRSESSSAHLGLIQKGLEDCQTNNHSQTTSVVRDMGSTTRHRAGPEPATAKPIMDGEAKNGQAKSSKLPLLKAWEVSVLALTLLREAHPATLKQSSPECPNEPGQTLATSTETVYLAVICA
jgi:hypothetical protein